jgi:porphobilinogen deaminase
MIAARYPQLVIKPLRGNLDTRLAKLDRATMPPSSWPWPA